MQVDVQHRPASSLAEVKLAHQEKIQVEAGAMVAMSPDIEMETEAKGGFLKSIARKMFGGESFFMNTYTAASEGDSILLAPPLPGDIAVVEMQGGALLVQSGAYLASSEGIQVDTQWTGAKTFFGGQGLIMLRISGTGTLILSSYGAIHPLEIGAGEKHVVDTGHLVTFEEQMGYTVKKVAGWKSTLFSGEMLVVELTGPGKVNLQTRSQDAFLSWLIPRLPKQTTVVRSGS